MAAEPRKYSIVREIGKGGMGTVYEVAHRVFQQRRRALKVLNPDLAGRKDLLDRFMKEAVRMARLQHPHIVMVHDIEEDEGFGTYIVMDLIEGQSLRDIIKGGGPLPYLDVLRIGSEIASALDVAHQQNIIHRDIKAQNILIERATGKAVLTDFGIAKEMHRDGEETLDGTATGVFIGTVRYACPEMFRMERAHPRWDLYALGAVLYESLSGRTYLEELSLDKIPTRIAYDPNFEVRLAYPQPPPEDFEHLVRECIQRDPEQRIDSAAKLLARLEQCKETYLTVYKKQQTQEALRSLHGETERDLGKLRAVQHQLRDLDISVGDGTRAEEIEDRLREIGELEEADRHNEALAQIEALRERVNRALQRNDHIARDQLLRALDGLAQRWSDLSDRAGSWLQGDEPAQVDALFARLRAALEAGEWAAVAQGVSDAPSLIVRLETHARGAAEPAVQNGLAAIAAAAEELQRLDPAALPRDLNLTTLQSEVAARLREGQLDAAGQQVETAQAIVSAALDRARRAAAERLRAARAECEQAQGGLDRAAAQALAAEPLAAAERALQAAQGAERAGDLRAAAAEYGRAADAYRGTAAAVAERQAAERGAAAAALREALAASAGEPEQVVGAARRAAAALLERLPAGHGDAIAALQARAADLQSARGGVAAFADAEVRRAEAQAAEQRAAGLAHVDREAQRAAARLSAEAARLFDAQQWADAAARYVDAAAAWQALEAKERVDALRDEVSGALQRLEQLAGHARALEVTVDAPAPGALKKQLEAATELARGGSREAAIEQLERLHQEVAAAATAQTAGLTDALRSGAAATQARWTDLARRAGALATNERDAEAQRLVQAVGATIESGAWDAARRALEAAAKWVERAETDLHRQAEQAAAADVKALEASVESLRKDGGAVPPAAEVGSVRQRIAETLRNGALAEAMAIVVAARAAADAALAAHREALAKQAATARAAADAAASQVETEAARLAVPQLLDDALHARQAGEEAEGRGELRAAAAAYGRAQAGFERTRAGLEEVRRRQVADAAGELRALLLRAAEAPAPLVGAARQAAEQTLRRAGDEAASVAALQELERAHAALTAALAEVERYREAEAKREEAEATVVRVYELPLTTEERDAATVVLRDAGRAFEDKEWDDARQRYAEAQSRLQSIADAAQRRIADEKARAERLAAARASLGGVVDEARALPEEVVGEALRAAQALLDAADPPLDGLTNAEAALTAARAEVPDYRRAAEQRVAARAAAEQAAQRQSVARFLKRPARTLERAEAAFVKRQWQAAAAGYGTSAQEYAAAETLKPAKVPMWAIPAAVVPLLAVAVYFVYPRAPVVPPRSDAPPPRVDAPPPPQPIVIAAAAPSGAAVNLKPGASQTFSIELPAGRRTDDIVWSLAGEPIAAARGKTTWQYTPDTAAAGESYEVAVKVDGGRAARQSQAWTVSIERPEPVVAEPPPAPPTIVVAALPSIAKADPATASVRVEEGGTQAFAIQLADAGANPDIEWMLDGKTVSDAAGKTSWQYWPDYAAAGSYDVAVTVNVGGSPQLRHEWTVDVADSNRGIELAQVLPPTSVDVKKPVGQRVDFAVKASDKDGDPLRYAWTVDGKAAGGNAPTLDLEVTKAGTQTVALAITDGKLAKPETLKWRVTGTALEFKPQVSPRTLSSLEYLGSQAFKIEPPAGVAAADMQIAWAVNGERVSDRPSFTFKADDPELIGADPVQVSVTARDAQGGQFAKTWSAKVLPPAPRIARAEPPSSISALKAGETQEFRVEAAPPIGNQRFTYSYSVNGRAAGSEPTLSLTAEAGKNYTVVASIRDNYSPRPAERTWKFSVPDDRPAATAAPAAPSTGGNVERMVEAWLDSYRGALNAKNTPQICAALGLSGDKCGALSRALASQEDLRVTFRGVEVTPSGDGACASYTRQDDFVDPAGKSQSRSTSVKQCFRVSNGQVQLVKN